LQAPLCVTVRVWPAIVNVPVREVVDVLAATLYDTVPVPVPLLPPVTVIHVVLLLTPVHAQPLLVVTVADCAPPAAATLCDVGARAKLQAPLCVTVRVCPAIVSVPVRGVVEVLAATLYDTVPVPVPLLPLVTVIHVVLLLTPVHVQPLPVVTVADRAPPVAGTF
jgi:hypothetical protein